MAKKKSSIPLFWKMDASEKLFAPLTISILNSEAYQDLTHGQKYLFTVCAMQRAANNKGQELPLDHFYMNRAMYTRYGWRQDSFIRDMSALIKNGFIDCRERGEYAKNLYAYSARWKCYGTEDGKPKPTDCTKALLVEMYPEAYAKEYLSPEPMAKSLDVYTKPYKVATKGKRAKNG